MGPRIVTWNVNGIRNPFAYQPWKDKRTFAAMFDTLEADIVILQETKIQRKDLRDDMVLVQGWDCHFSFPKHEKGKFGVVIYTRQSACAPIRAEEGLTGVLCPPKSATPYRDLPADQQIGGYPTAAQAHDAPNAPDIASDFDLLDNEGRCVILEFPAFVLLGLYNPATRDESRNAFRLSFLNLLDIRIRNLVAMGKRVVVTGDLNVIKWEPDMANCLVEVRKQGKTLEEYFSTPSRRFINELLDDGLVWGERNKGREEPVLHDVCRGFHPNRRDMYTHWDTKLNARPGNYGARIDYILCSLDMKDWFVESNIQEGIMGSDHCPVYALLKDEVTMEGESVNIYDALNPAGVFKKGVRHRDISKTELLPLSGRLISEFSGRRSIKDMFARIKAAPPAPRIPSASGGSPADTSAASSHTGTDSASGARPSQTAPPVSENGLQPTQSSAVPLPARKRSPPSTSPVQPKKRSKPSGASRPKRKAFVRQKAASTSSLKPPDSAAEPGTPEPSAEPSTQGAPATPVQASATSTHAFATPTQAPVTSARASAPTASEPGAQPAVMSSPLGTHSSPVHDPVAVMEQWSRIFTKKAAPRCEGHQEACKTMTTRKAGANCGRSFWMCAKPLGPSGQKETGTEWRCGTFIWCSDWNGSAVS